MLLRRAMSIAMRPIYGRIHAKLTESLSPVTLPIKDESFMHAGHSGNPSGDPDAEAFAGMNMVARHRLVYGLLDQEIKDGVHALSLKTKTPSEAEKEPKPL